MTRRDTGREGRSALDWPFDLHAEINVLAQRLTAGLLEVLKVAALEAVAEGLSNARSDAPPADPRDPSMEGTSVER